MFRYSYLESSATDAQDVVRFQGVQRLLDDGSHVTARGHDELLAFWWRDWFEAANSDAGDTPQCPAEVLGMRLVVVIRLVDHSANWAILVSDADQHCDVIQHS